ncbi:MAG: sodium:solute symporter family transporter, partial [Fusobacteriaceae bacterium]
DTVVPVLALTTLHPILAGVFIAGPLAAIMSTIDSLLIQSSATIIKDLYIRYILRGAEPEPKKIKFFSRSTSLILGAIIFAFAFYPPDLIVTLNLLFLAGLEAIFFCPIIFGLYYKKANATGALSAIFFGFGSFIFFFIAKINFFGMHNIVPVIFLATVSFFIGNYFGKSPSEQINKIFFGD